MKRFLGVAAACLSFLVALAAAAADLETYYVTTQKSQLGGYFPCDSYVHTGYWSNDEKDSQGNPVPIAVVQYEIRLSTNFFSGFVYTDLLLEVESEEVDPKTGQPVWYSLKSWEGRLDPVVGSLGFGIHYYKLAPGKRVKLQATCQYANGAVSINLPNWTSGPTMQAIAYAHFFKIAP